MSGLFELMYRAKKKNYCKIDRKNLQLSIAKYVCGRKNIHEVVMKEV